MDLVCLTMIIFVREYCKDSNIIIYDLVLLSDNSGCLQRLMKYPPL